MKQKAGRARGQMSEAMITVLFLSLSGGLQDAYSYLSRGHVFANAQTGNIVLLSALRPVPWLPSISWVIWLTTSSWVSA